MSAAALKHLRVRQPASVPVMPRTADLHSWNTQHAAYFGKGQRITVRTMKCPCGCGTRKHPRTIIRAINNITAIVPETLTAYWPAGASQPVRCSAVGLTRTNPSLPVGLRCTPSGDPLGWVLLACLPTLPKPDATKPPVPGGTTPP